MTGALRAIIGGAAGDAVRAEAAWGKQKDKPFIASGNGKPLHTGDAQGAGKLANGLPATGEFARQASADVPTCMSPFSSKLKKRGWIP